MIIKSDAFEMGSKRQFASRRLSRHQMESGIVEMQDGGEKGSGSQSAWGRNFAGMNGFGRGSFLSTLAYTKDGTYVDEKSGVGDIPAVRQGRMSDLQRVGAVSEEMGDFENMQLQMKFQTLNFLFQIFFGRDSARSLQDSYWASATPESYQTIQFSETYEETEMTSFETTGKVCTEDGREIEFNLNVGMSRSFYQETNISIFQKKPIMVDPLVIHLNGNVDAVSDQTFFFDLDADGEEEEISSLNPGHGFLALDKDGDGVIGDGSELFGALSGNGFAELAAYDLDGNGWIDEADEIFDKLRVWSVDEKGNPQLFSLKDSDIGAICLAAASTQFSITDEENTTKAMVRSTGFFLHESTGAAGAVQQIDLAKME